MRHSTTLKNRLKPLQGCDLRRRRRDFALLGNSLGLSSAGRLAASKQRLLAAARSRTMHRLIGAFLDGTAFAFGGAVSLMLGWPGGM
jgi:hypothetical protein